VQNVEAAANLNAFEPTLLPITYVENVPNTDSTGGHGTHVAGIVGGTGALSNGKHEGVAPGANLIGYGSGAGLFLLDTLGGFDYTLTHQTQYGIRVITNSWGTTSDVATDFDPNDPINVATKRLYDRGVVVVFSAGNSGPNAGTITGNYKKAPWVIAVAAGDKQRGLAGFSSRGRAGVGGTVTVDGQTFTWYDQPSVTAPGVKIISTRVVSPVGVLGTPDDVKLIEPAYIPFYTTLSGTSMAAPHVAGIVALMLEANPQLTPAQVKKIIMDTATDMPGYQTFEVGEGYVDAYASVDRAFRIKR
jgi:serine protease AprX